MQFRLRTLLIVLVIGPPLLAGMWWAWPKVSKPPKQPSFDELIELITRTIRTDSWDDVGEPGSIDHFSTIRCFQLTETEDDPVGPDPCGRSYLFKSYSPDDEDENSPNTPLLDDDPFAPGR